MVGNGVVGCRSKKEGGARGKEEREERVCFSSHRKNPHCKGKAPPRNALI